jgi:hypothetical protein
MAKRYAAIIAGWVASNALWTLFAPGLGLVVGAVVTYFVDLPSPWSGLFAVGITMMVAALVLGIVRPIVEPHLPHFTPTMRMMSTYQAQTRRDAQNLSEANAYERKVRSAAQTIRGELEFNRRLLADADDDGEYWGVGYLPMQEFRGSAWSDSRDVLAGDHRFVDAFRKAESAYHELDRMANVVWRAGDRRARRRHR